MVRIVAGSSDKRQCGAGVDSIHAADHTTLRFFVFLIKVVNILSGALVAGHWGFTMTEWLKEVVGKRRRASSEGMLGAKGYHAD